MPIVVFSPDGTKFATATHNQSIAIWALGQRKELVQLKQQIRRILACSFSPNGRYLAFASEGSPFRDFRR